MGTNPGGAAAGLAEAAGVGFVGAMAGDGAAKVTVELRRENVSDSEKNKRDWFFIIILVKVGRPWSFWERMEMVEIVVAVRT